MKTIINYIKSNYKQINNSFINLFFICIISYRILFLILLDYNLNITLYYSIVSIIGYIVLSILYYTNNVKIIINKYYDLILLEMIIYFTLNRSE